MFLIITYTFSLSLRFFFFDTFFSMIFFFVHVNASRFSPSANGKRNCAVIHFAKRAFSQRTAKLEIGIRAYVQRGCRVTINLQLARHSYLLYGSHWPNVAAIISRRNYLPSAVNCTCTLHNSVLQVAPANESTSNSCLGMKKLASI